MHAMEVEPNEEQQYDEELADQINELIANDLRANNEAHDHDQNLLLTLTGIGTLVPATGYQNICYGVPIIALRPGYLPPFMRFPTPGTTYDPPGFPESQPSISQQPPAMYNPAGQFPQPSAQHQFPGSSTDTGGSRRQQARPVILSSISRGVGVGSSSQQVRPVIPSGGGVGGATTSGQARPPHPGGGAGDGSSSSNRQGLPPLPPSTGRGSRRHGLPPLPPSARRGRSRHGLPPLPPSAGRGRNRAADRQPTDPEDDGELRDIQITENIRMYELVEALHADIAEFKNKISGQISDSKRQRKLRKEKLLLKRGKALQKSLQSDGSSDC